MQSSDRISERQSAEQGQCDQATEINNHSHHEEQSQARGPSLNQTSEHIIMDGRIPVDESDTTTTDASHTILLPGDHLYQWCSIAGIPGMYQHHGIVLHARYGDDNENDDNNNPEELVLVDCSILLPETKQAAETETNDDTASASSLPKNPCKTLVRKNPNSSSSFVEKNQPSRHWHKVTYEAPLWKRHLYRSGTCTSVPTDPVGLVLMRLHFLLNHSTVLPPYHAVRANCECVAVWCKTGTWATLQASSFLELTAAGQMKSATTLAMLASSQQVTVPAAGVWGWLGVTTKVSLVATQPLLLPAIATYGVVSVGGPVWMLYRAKQAWKDTTERLHEEFWNAALDDPDAFAQRMTEYSSNSSSNHISVD